MEDVEFVANNLRKEDREEILASVGIEPSLALPAYVREGREVYAAGLCSDNRAEILYGFDPIFGVDRAAVIWLLSTPRIYDHPVEFVMRTKELYEEAHQRFDLLTNFIDARNRRHIVWLRSLGFVMLRRVEKFGYAGTPFIEFASFRPSDIDSKETKRCV
jgi:hypothetical protein